MPDRSHGVAPAADGRPGPDLSIVVVTRDTSRPIRRTIEALLAQTARERIELVVAAPARECVVDLVTELDGRFRGLRVAAVGPFTSRGIAAAGAVGEATAPLVGFLENHSYPDPGWAEALLARHAGPWGAVGPSVRNANPETLTSWANFLISYSTWVHPVPGGPVALLPFHNTVYKRALLVDFGDRLGELLNREGHLQRELSSRGHRLYLEPTATTAHVNEAVLVTSLRLLSWIGRIYAADRSARWPALRRGAYVAGSPLVALVHLPRILRDARRTPEGRRILVRLFPSLCLHLLAWGAGEARGYAAGAGSAEDLLNDHEFLGEERLGRAR